MKRYQSLHEEVQDMIKQDGGAGLHPPTPISDRMPLDFATKVAALQKRMEDARRERLAAFRGNCAQCFDEPRPCNHCQRGRDYITQEQEQQYAQELAAFQESANIPRAYRKLGLDSFPSQDVVRSFKETPVTLDQWLLLSGSVGVGKTGLVCAILQRQARLHYLVKDSFPKALFIPSPELLNSLKNSYDSSSTEKVISRYHRVPLLIIDDLGAERSSDWAREQLFEIINHRYNEELPIWVTTNHPITEGGHSPLASAIGERTFWRLYERSRLVTLAGPNLRRRER